MTPEMTYLGAKSVRRLLARHMGWSYHRLGHAQLLGQGLAADGMVVEEMPYKGTDGAGVGRRAERQEEEWVVECCSGASISFSVVRLCNVKDGLGICRLRDRLGSYLWT